VDTLPLKKISSISGSVNLPGSKSLSNRALLLASVAQGTTVLSNLLDSDDVRRMLEALEKLGVSYSLSDDRTECTVTGLSGPFKTEGMTEIFLGNAGTAMRPLAAVLCLSSGTFILTGEPRMYERPIAHLIDAMRETGAEVEYLGNEGYPPLKITGKSPKKSPNGNIMHINGTVSSQFLTAALMAAPLFMHDLTIEITGDLVSRPYIDITLKLMKDFGVEVVNNSYKSFFIRGGQHYVSPGRFLVEGDASGASYFLAAGAIGGTATVTGLGCNSIQGDLKFIEVLKAMGADVSMTETSVTCTRKGKLKGIDMDMNHIPDAAMTAAVLALFADGATVIRNIYNWRVKETDRIAAMATELRKLGAEVEEGKDFLKIEMKQPLKSASIDTYNDHRMAMCFSLAALGIDIVINDPKCTSKTFPDYFTRFESICRR
jgi:3-phosphoshikimate 1-carboxyvinyltransferase